jgi:hypothetical protein
MQANKLRIEIKTTLNSLSRTGPLLKGSISKVILGKKTTAPGNRVAYLLTYKSQGNKTKSIYLKKNQINEVKTMIQRYQTLKKDINKLIDLNVKLFKATQSSVKSYVN